MNTSTKPLPLEVDNETGALLNPSLGDLEIRGVSVSNQDACVVDIADPWSPARYSLRMQGVYHLMVYDLSRLNIVFEVELFTGRDLKVETLCQAYEDGEYEVELKNGSFEKTRQLVRDGALTLVRVRATVGATIYAICKGVEVFATESDASAEK